ncbi:uncharacterized protein F5891DRAFT_3233 [Suillus fuscotomentosus]|uniref:Uncharacterized protein n=1 Tax=Suillus fuscotomentosus TaxID=1912939 RepID=A0AAD4ENT6_9AGAM|nr:uncharacterized protein F5891DRAFT_3233 [Suillus fuscotomentosus]KAG1908178.1 hypothetical protein F5891DRAFT_3233 [Suillus fuscotomentosus]
MRSLLSPLHHLLNLAKSATKAALKRRLVELAEQVDDGMKNQFWKDDPWLSQLDRTPIAGVLWPLNRGISMSMYHIAPILLHLSWQGWPLFYSRECGWTFCDPNADFHTRFLKLDSYDPTDDTLQNMCLKGALSSTSYHINVERRRMWAVRLVKRS